MTSSTPQSGAGDARTAAADTAFRRFLQTGDPAAIADLFDLAAGDLHRTALHLVGDDATAHDLVQITFLVALQRRGFDATRPVLPWLAGILRHQAAMVHRRRAQRLDRTRLAAEPSEDPAQRAEELELVDEIEAALARLPGSLRPVVRLHVLHGLAASAIAASLQRPGGTVRTQLMRGLEQLRRLLPIGVAGVIAGLLPSTGRAAVRASVLAAAGGGATRAAMATFAALPARDVALAVLAVMAVAWLWWQPANGPAPNAAATPAPAVPPVVADRTPTAPANERTLAPAAAAAFELRGVVTGTVRGVDGAPGADADVLLWPQARPAARGAAFEPPPVATARTAADGSFAISGNGAMCYVIARTADAISEHAITGELRGRERVEGLELRLQPLVELHGLLLDADERPVANFAFGTHRGSSHSAADELAIPGFRRAELPHLDVRTDAGGHFAVRAAAQESYCWEVQHPEHPMLRVHHRAVDGELTLRLERGAELHGVVWDWRGAPAAGAEVELADWPRRHAVCDADGTFRLRGAWLREGLWLRVTQPGAAIACLPVIDANTRLEVRLAPALALAGRLLDAAGQPLAARELRIVGDRTIDTGARYAGETSTWEYVVGKSRTRTGDDGTFRFDDLYDGLFAIQLGHDVGEFETLLQARAGSEQLVLRVADRSVFFEGRLRDALTGAAIEACAVTVWRRDADGKGSSGRTRKLPAPEGAFVLDGVAAGAARLVFAAEGFADVEVPEREYSPGRQTLQVAMHPARNLEVVVRDGGNASARRVGVHLGDGKPLMLPNGLGTSTHRDLHQGRVRLEKLPARVVTVVLERSGAPDLERTIDLTQPQREPLVFDVDAALPAPIVCDVLVLHAGKDADPRTWAGAVDREWWQRAQQNPALSPPNGEVKVEITDDTGRELAWGMIKPVAAAPGEAAPRSQFDVSVSNSDGTGQQATMPVPALRFSARADVLVVRVEAEGRAPVTRRVVRGELTGDDPAIAVILLPR